MPKDIYKMRKVRGKDCYKTYNTVSKKVFAICTTKEKAIRQLAILRKIIYSKKLEPQQKQSKKTIKKRTPLIK